MATVDNLDIQVTASAESAESALNRLAAAVGRLRGAAAAAGGAARDLAGAARDAGTASRRAGEQAGNAEQHTRNYGRAAEEAGNSARRGSSGVATFWQSLRNFGHNAFASISFLPRFFGKELVSSIKKPTEALGDFFAGIKRIAYYRLIRSIIKAVTKTISEGIKNLYAWSKTADGSFRKTMDGLATSAQYLGNSFAAMASPLIEALSPAIDFIVDKFVWMFNIINQIFARLAGKTSYTAAKKVAAQWGGAAKSAGKSASDSAKDAADEIKRTILGFDEINKLNDDITNSNSGSGGNGGGGGSGGGAGAMFEEVPIDNAIASFADQLKAAFLEGDWQTLGTLLGEKVNELVESIDWAGAGSTVGYYINGWFSTKYWTLDTINFTNIGSKIAEFLNNAIAEIDFNIIGRSLVQKMTIIGDLIIGFFTDFDWGQAADKLSSFVEGIYNELTKWFNKYDWSKVGNAIADGLIDFIGNLDYDGMANSMYEALSAAFEAGVGLLSGFFDTLAGKFKVAINWNSLTNEVQSAVEGLMAVLGGATLVLGAILAFSGAATPLGIGLIAAGAAGLGTSLSLMWDGLSDKVKEKVELLKGILSGALLVIGAILTFSGADIPHGLALMSVGSISLAGTLGANWDAISDAMRGSIGTITAIVSGASLALGAILLFTGVGIPLGLGLIAAGAGGLATSIAPNWDSIVNTISSICDNIKNAVSTWWDNTKSWFTDIGTNIWNGIQEGIVKPLANIGTWIKTNIFDPFLNWLKSVFGIASPAKTMEEPGENIVLGILQGIINALKNIGTWVKENIFDPFMNALKNAGEWVIGIGAKITTSAKSLWEGIKSAWGKLTDTVVEFAANVKNEATKWWNNVTSWWEEKVGAVKEFFTNVANNSAAWWQNVKTWWASKVDAVQEFVTNVKNDATTWWSNVTSWWGEKVGAVKEFFTNVANNSGAWWQNVKTWWASKVDAVQEFVTNVKNDATTWWSNVTSWWGTEVQGKALDINAKIITAISDLWNSVQTAWDSFVAGKWLSIDVKYDLPETPSYAENPTQNDFFNQLQYTLDGSVWEVPVVPVKADNWQDEWAELFDDELDVQAKVALLKNGWTSISEFVGTVVDVFTNLNKNGWSTISAFVGTAVSVATSLTKSGWSSIGGYVGTAVTVATSLTKKGWTSIGAFVGTAVSVVATLSAKNKTSNVFATSLDVSGKMKAANKTSNVFDTSLSISGKMKAANKTSSVFDTKLDVSGDLTSASANRIRAAATKAMKGIEVTVKAKNSGGGAKLETKKKGGAITPSGQQIAFAGGGIINNGFVQRLPHYASGTTNAHGTLFVAGEAGPEILGHIGGRTEILNKSQLAQTMFAAVRSAMSGVRIDAAIYNGGSDAESDYETMYSAMYNAFTAAMAQSNERDREKVALLRQINAKEFIAEVTAASINRAQTRQNRRAGTTITPVGT